MFILRTEEPENVVCQHHFRCHLSSSSAVKGKTPQVGDRVLVEAVYNANLPFKWNAQRIQTLPQLTNQSVRAFTVCTRKMLVRLV